jgi:hypothetical protein
LVQDTGESATSCEKANNIPFKLSGQGYGTAKKAIKES